MWNPKYRILKEGEIINEGDQFMVSSAMGWMDAQITIGAKAPNPQYASHAIYRRLNKVGIKLMKICKIILELVRRESNLK